MQEDFTLFLTVALLQIYDSPQTDTFRLNLDKVLFPTHNFLHISFYLDPKSCVSLNQVF